MQRSPHASQPGAFINHFLLRLTAVFIILIGLLASGQLAGRTAFAQTATPTDYKVTIGQFDTSKYPEITIYVNVTDSSGKNVTNLKQDDFSVTEDSEKVTIVNYAGIGQSRPVDIVYVFDTTGSMANEINGVIQTSIAFADGLKTKGRDYRLGLVTFADIVLTVNRQDDTLTDDAEEFKRWVSSLKAEGGDADPENDYGAIKRASQMKFRDGAQKILILITDAPPHHYNDQADGGHLFDDSDLDNKRILDLLKSKNISVYAVTPDFSEFITLATDSGGKFYDLNKNPNFTGLIEVIGQTIANQYRITYKSPRPTYDGTRRDVTVTVGGKVATQEYSEKHLLNVQSNCLIGLLCMVPLMAALVIPLAGQALLGYLRKRSGAGTPGVTSATGAGMGRPSQEKAPGISYQPPLPSEIAQPPMPPAPPLPVYPGSPNPIPQVAVQQPAPAAIHGPIPPVPLSEAAYPGPLKGSAAPQPLAVPLICQNCGRALKSTARFCPGCGHPVGSSPPGAPALESRELSVSQSPVPASVCPNCGSTLRPGVKFCNSCGYKL
jgi:VWFA-related protein